MPRLGIETGGRFVQENGRGILENRNSNSAFLPHAFRKTLQAFRVVLLGKSDSVEYLMVIIP